MSIRQPLCEDEVEVGESAGRSTVGMDEVVKTRRASFLSDEGGRGDDDKSRAQFDRAFLGLMTQASSGATLQGPVDYDSDESGGESATVSDRSAEERSEKRAAEYGELTELGDRLKKVSGCQMANVLRKARFATNSPRRGGETKQLQFGLEGSEMVDSLETANGIYERVLAGRVLTQVIARTGIGKTTKFAGMIAAKSGCRVLLLEPTVVLSSAAGDRLKSLSKVRTRWLRSREESVTTMTYHDFCGHFQTNGGKSITEQFDMIIMDEAHMPFAEVQGAKSIFATKASQDGPSLIVLSATVDGQDSQAVNNVAPTRELRGTLMDAIRAGYLTEGSRAKDRTMFIVATDQEAAEAVDAIEDRGHVAFVLDSASRTTEYWAVVNELKKQSVNKRFVVITNEFGTGTNLPVSQVYMSGVRVVHELNEDNEIVTRRIGLTVSERKQQAGRVGRGMATGSDSFCFSECEAQDDVQVLESEKVKLYLYLRAAGIKPLKAYLPSETLFPFGVTPEVAANILAVNLPCELAIRFFNKDGCLSPNIARALAPFSHVQHYFITSPGEPIGYEDWVVEKTGGYYGIPVATLATAKVPCSVADEELRAKLHVIAAIAQGRIDVGEYVPRLSDGETSEEEVTVAPVRRGGRMPRLVVEAVRPPPPPPKSLPWGFDAPTEGQLSFRQRPQPLLPGSSYASAVIRSLADTEHVLSFPTGQFTEKVDDDGVTRVEVRSPTLESEASPIEFKSPKGSVVVTVRKSIWERLLASEALSPSETLSLLRNIKHNVIGFANSDAFSNWNNAWLGVLRTFQDGDNLRELQKRNLMSAAAALMFQLYNRYMAGVESVTSSSYVKAKFWSRILKGRTVEEQLKRDRERGKVEIMQSSHFFERVVLIRTEFTLVMQEFEKAGWFAPMVRTRLQEILPMMGTAQRTMDDGVLRVARGQSGATLHRPGSSKQSTVLSERSWRDRSVR